jgi:glucokinase
MARYALGIDVGGTSVKAVILSENGRASHLTALPTRSPSGPNTVLDIVLTLIGGLIKKLGTIENILGVGVGTPGTIDSSGTVIGGAHNIPGWLGTRVFKPIVKQFGLNAAACNDTTAMTLAEWRYGAAVGFSNVVCLALGTGIGGGMILGNRLYEGARGLAGEFGHVSVDYNGVLCKCGQRGCSECYASATGIVQTALAISAGLSVKDKTPFSRLVEEALVPLTSKTVFDYVKKGDSVALSVLEEVCDKLARTLGVIINTLTPERIVLGGGVMNAGRIIIDTARKKVPRYCLADSLKNCTLVCAGLGERAGVIGAAQLVFEKMSGKSHD